MASAPMAAEPAPEPARKGWLDRLKSGLRKTGSSIATVFTGTRIDDALYEELEDALLMADTGVKATQWLLTDLKRRVKEAKATEPAAVTGLLAEAMTELLRPLEKPLVIGEHQPTVIMVAGVNGAGKTTSIGKLTRHLAQHDQKVLLAAADTFRAAAREQLGVWADRNTVEIVSQEGGDPAAVSFDAVTAGKARGKDVVLVDTAGRLPTQLHLMEELKKIRRVVTKAEASAPHEVLLVIDGNTGQNALTQVRTFDDALQLTGLIVTKLDGTAKGGVLAAIAHGNGPNGLAVVFAALAALGRLDQEHAAVYFQIIYGALREPMRRLNSVTALVWNGGAVAQTEHRVAPPQFRMMLSGHRFSALSDTSRQCSADDLRGRRLFAIAGIGDLRAYQDRWHVLRR